MAVMTFEKALEKLEGVTKALSEGDLPLDKAMKLYQEGLSLCGHCEKLLSEAKLKVQEWDGEQEGEKEIEGDIK